MIYIKKLFSYSYSMQNASTRSILAMFLISLVFSFSTFFIAMGGRVQIATDDRVRSPGNQMQFDVGFKILEPSGSVVKERPVAELKQSEERKSSMRKRIYSNFLQKLINPLIHPAVRFFGR